MWDRYDSAMLEHHPDSDMKRPEYMVVEIEMTDGWQMVTRSC